MDAVHATWVDGKLRLWVESFTRFVDQAPSDHEDEHPFIGDPAAALSFLEMPYDSVETVELLLPSRDSRPLPSPELAHAAGRAADPEANEDEPPFLESYKVATVSPRAADISAVLDRLLDASESEGSAESGGVAVSTRVLAGASIRSFAVAARVARHLLAQQRFVPMLLHKPGGAMSAGWRPWLSDEHQADRVMRLARSMPPACRASAKSTEQDSMAVVEAFLGTVIDSTVRGVLRSEGMMEALEAGGERGAGVDDPHVLWLGGLLGEERSLTTSTMLQSEMIKSVREWIGALDVRGQTSSWRLGVRVEEPVDLGIDDEGDEQSELEMSWLLRFELRSAEDPRLAVWAEDVWALPAEGTTIEGKRLENPHELLLTELGRASRICPAFEQALTEPEPSMLLMTTMQAYEFLREHRLLLEEQGVTVQVPDWWESPAMRLGTKLQIDSGPPGEDEHSGMGDSAGSTRLGLGTLVNYHWEIVVGDKTLSLHEFEELANRNTPLVRFGGKWVEIRPEDVNAALEFIRENPGGKMAFGEAMRLAYATDSRKTGVPVLGLEIGGWLSALLEQSGMGQKLPEVELPDTFLGTLRPYQLRGVSWLAFLERFGFGACLADDMGLGKTVQLLALLAYERAIAKQTRDHKEVPDDQKIEKVDAEHELVMPTLLVVPMSVVGNWQREAERFCPSLQVVIHHGPERMSGDALIEQCANSDVVVTTYALAHRDKDTIEKVRWRRIVLDEAQFIKNPTTKQSQAVRALPAERRIALTGTPVENRLSELWSIMDFLNPGYLGTAGNFQRRFSVPIERYRDKARGEQLRSLIGPFVLRRVKTDPTIIADLPEKIETREYCHLTREQAELYESTVKRVLAEVEQSQGMHRRGMVLSALIRLKQVCNHPAQALKDSEPGTPPDPSRSGKSVRLLEMLDEMLAAGDRALIFTQFRQMGQILSVMLRHELGREVLFLHGGSTQKQRMAMIDQFQDETGKIPIMILSLKAGGVGLNLTAANHVFHYDRWWNPAVENQATDRAFRIGQTRTVHVHKFVVRGTLEERIDEMIEQKTELAESIVGSGERWLTDLSSDDLKRILTMRQEAVTDEV